MSTLTLKELSAPAGEVIKIAAGKTLDLKSQGSVTMPTGSVLQVVQESGASRTTVSSSATWTSTTLTQAVTPTSTSSKILIGLSQHIRVFGSHTNVRGGLRLLRDSTVIWNTVGTGETVQVRGSPSEIDQVVNIQFLDSPSTTSAVTYTLQIRGHTSSDSIIAFESSYGANLILQEIQG